VVIVDPAGGGWRADRPGVNREISDVAGGDKKEQHSGMFC
jgi:hypothetical protein